MARASPIQATVNSAARMAAATRPLPLLSRPNAELRALLYWLITASSRYGMRAAASPGGSRAAAPAAGAGFSARLGGSRGASYRISPSAGAQNACVPCQRSGSASCLANRPGSSFVSAHTVFEHRLRLECTEEAPALILVVVQQWTGKMGPKVDMQMPERDRHTSTYKLEGSLPGEALAYQ